MPGRALVGFELLEAGNQREIAFSFARSLKTNVSPKEIRERLKRRPNFSEKACGGQAAFRYRGRQGLIFIRSAAVHKHVSKLTEMLFHDVSGTRLSE
jgi:hypothetical protein